MKTIKLGASNLEVGEISLGCMRMANLSIDDAAQVIESAREVGINLFDHADIYGGGKSKRYLLSIRMNPTIREGLIIQTKCGIRKGFFDFSKEHIIYQ